MTTKRGPTQGVTLPDECLLIIAKYCDSTTLGQFRLASSTTSALALSHMFASIRLVPNIDCLTSFEQIFRDSPASSVIRTVIYDLSWETTISDLISRCDSAKSDSSVDSCKTRPPAWTQKVDLDQLRRIYSTRLTGPSASSDEIRLLNNVLSCTPEASGLEVVSDRYDRDYYRPVPFFYKTVLSTVDMVEARPSLLLPLGPSTDDSSHLNSVIAASRESRRPLPRFTLQDAKWSSLGGHFAFAAPSQRNETLSSWKSVLENVLDLRLSFRGSLSRQSVDSIRPLRRFLKACKRVRTLRLSFNEPIQKRYSHDHRLCSYLGPLMSPGSSARPLMPNLESLDLRNTTTSQPDLVKFLAIHAKSLRKLTLANISLLRNDGQERRSCWVETIKSLKSLLNLAQVEFGGYLTNGGRQKWYVSENAADSRRIRPRVQRYITDKTTKACPLEALAISASQEDVQEALPGTDEFRGDWTWAMLYPAANKRHYVSEQMFSGDHFFSEDTFHRTVEETAAINSSARLRSIRASLGQPIPPAADFSMSWSSFQPPPAKKIKSTHTPISIPSPSSIWSSSPEAWDSPTSSAFEPPVTTASKSTGSSFNSKAANFSFTAPSLSVKTAHTPKFGLSHAFWGGPKPPSTAFGWPATSAASMLAKNGATYEEHVTPFMSLTGTAQQKGSSDASYATAGTSASATTSLAEMSSASSFGFLVDDYKNVEMLDMFGPPEASSSTQYLGVPPCPQMTIGGSHMTNSTSEYLQAFPPAQYQPTLDSWWMHSGDGKSSQAGENHASSTEWLLPSNFNADPLAEMQVDSEFSHGKGKGKATAW